MRHVLNYLHRLLRGTVAIGRAELSLLRRFPRIVLAMLAVGVVPAIYALIYLTSVWDPAGHTGDLPAAIVNEDEGVTYLGHSANVGNELTRTLLEKQAFGFRKMPDTEAARAAVRRGQLAFALLIPKDFSAQALPGATRGAGQLVVYTSEGNNYSSAGFARRFAGELGHQVNEMLNEQRWALVLDIAAGSQEKLTRLKQGLAQLRDGSEALATGTAQYRNAAQKLAGGFKQVDAGIRTMHARLPAEADLRALRAGSQQLVSGQQALGSGLAQLDAGLEQLDGGAVQLADGARRMQKETAGILIVGERIASGAGELATGADRLRTGIGQARTGLTQARAGNQQLTSGSQALDEGVGKLTDGMSALGEGIRTMASRLPEDRQLDEFARGGDQLAQGAQKLVSGLQVIEAALPASITRVEGSASGLAGSVEPHVEVVAPVMNNGEAFIPNMVSVALWIGAVMAGFLFNQRIVLHVHGDFPRLSKTLGKMAVPVIVVLLQVSLVLATLLGVLHVRTPNVLELGVTMALASIVFLAMLAAMLHVFGDFGRILTVLLLTLQLSAGGGVLPVELSAGFFRAVHAWLPFSWVVQAFRAVLFGAFDDGWAHACLIVMLSGAIAIALMAIFGRWEKVTHEAYRPTLNV
ncbi:YhgE/Pip domain-containing protein [Variovorax sp. J22R133]|uniref:YhgE/Pip domain-containing protein n=1 Tax=Variovorax brevis TaxID=3053503 RepID=UPI002575D1B3|nr:YhgE/Pip domain-containing protein [Variovorax sp. J22R133]MDM0111888.1 YhgE/Pip domain-containing protein [Variovorax sp. J22R133]